MSRITQGLLANEQELKMAKKKMIKEAGSGEMYASKAAMKKHEAKESPAMEKAEHKMRGGGIAVKGKGIALRGGGIATRGMGVALKKGGMGRKGK
jgi:hypothetical protein